MKTIKQLSASNFNLLPRIVDKNEVLEKILNNVKRDDIISVSIFGSVIHPKIKKTKYPKRNFFGCIVGYEYEIEKLKPKDIDILVIVRSGKGIKEYKEDLMVEQAEWDGGYGFDWVKREKIGYLHLLVATKKDFDKAVKDGDEDANRILKTMKTVFKGD